MYHALHQSRLSSQYIIQDVAIPYAQASTFMTYLETSFKRYPIWLCPLKQSGKTASTHSLQVGKTNRKMPEMMLNFGVWGPGPSKRDEFVAWNRAFEQKVHELGGQKWLYAHTYYSEAEFDEIYDRKEYDLLRGKYRATYLPTVYDKVKVDTEKEKGALFHGVWPLAGLYGVYKVMRGGDYLLSKNSGKS
jgi:delta24-sterol reductase